MTGDGGQIMDEEFELRVAAGRVKSGSEFVKFLDMLQKEVREDDELERRPQLEFFQVIDAKLNYCLKFADYEDAGIELPEQPDWNWLARLFFVGAFEN
jgi:hypothetical protein